MSYPPQPPRHKVFVSFHHDDQKYKDWFVTVMKDDIVDKSVEDGDIDDRIKVETIRQKIRDDFIADATVTIVLIGPCTWQRKHVDLGNWFQFEGHQAELQMRFVGYSVAQSPGFWDGKVPSSPDTAEAGG